jgi:DME family drug/metabolite transporter
VRFRLPDSYPCGAPRVKHSRRAMGRRLGTAAVAAAASGWGLWALFTRGGRLGPAWQSVLILAVIALAWLPLSLSRSGRPHARRRPARLWLLLALLGLLDAGNYLLYFAAVERGPLATAVLAHYLAPLLVAALAPALLREPLGARTLPALAASMCGLVLLVGSGSGSPLALTTALLGAGSAAFYAGTTLLGKRLLDDFSPSELLAYHSAASALLLLPLAGPLPPLRAFLGRPLLGALLLGAGGGALYFAGLRRVPASRAAVLTYLEPLVASLVGALAFGELLGPLGLVGALLMLAGGAAVVAGDN